MEPSHTSSHPSSDEQNPTDYNEAPALQEAQSYRHHINRPLTTDNQAN